MTNPKRFFDSIIFFKTFQTKSLKASVPRNHQSKQQTCLGGEDLIPGTDSFFLWIWRGRFPSCNEKMTTFQDASNHHQGC